MGYALDYLFKHIFEEQGEDAYDAFSYSMRTTS